MTIFAFLLQERWQVLDEDVPGPSPIFLRRCRWHLELSRGFLSSLDRYARDHPTSCVGFGYVYGAQARTQVSLSPQEKALNLAQWACSLRHRVLLVGAKSEESFSNCPI